MNDFRLNRTLACAISATTLLCFTACSVTPAARKINLALHPPEGAMVENTKKFPIVTWRMRDAEVSLSPVGELDDDLLDLWLAFNNKGEQPFTVLPSQIEYAYCMPPPAKRHHIGDVPAARDAGLGARPPGSTAMVCTAFQAVPDDARVSAHLAAREQRRQEADRADEAALVMVALLTVVAVIFVVAALSSGSSSGDSSRRGGTSSSSRLRSSAPGRIASEVAWNVATTPTYVPPTAGVILLPTSAPHSTPVIQAAQVPPGAIHTGHIYIPPNMNASLLRLRMTIGDEQTTVDFSYLPIANAAPRYGDEYGG